MIYNFYKYVFNCMLWFGFGLGFGWGLGWVWVWVGLPNLVNNVFSGYIHASSCVPQSSVIVHLLFITYIYQ